MWLDPIFEAKKHWNLIYLGILFWVVFWFKNVNLPSAELEITRETFLLIQRRNSLAQLPMFILTNLQIISSYVPAFSITTYKAQALIINRLLVNLQASLGVLQVVSLYVPLGRVKKASDLAILRLSDMKVLQIRPSPAQMRSWSVWMNWIGRRNKSAIMWIFEIVFINKECLVRSEKYLLWERVVRVYRRALLVALA